MNRIDYIKYLYKLILGRDAEEKDLQHYGSSDLSLYDIQLELWESIEFQNKYRHQLFIMDDYELDNDINIYIINLQRREDRKQQITSRLNDLKIKNYTFIDAIDGKELTPEEVKQSYNDKRSKEIHREMTLPEIACALSHIKCAKKMLNEGLDYAIILEDDARLTLNFKYFLKEFNTNYKYEFDYLILGAFSSNEFFNEKLKSKSAPCILTEPCSIVYLDNAKYSIGDTSVHDAYYPTKHVDYVHGAHAYIMSKEGAKKLLEINYPVIVEADNIWNYFPDSCKVEFTNPILCHRQREDSDIHDYRINLSKDDNNFSKTFLERKYHNDFGI